MGVCSFAYAYMLGHICEYAYMHMHTYTHFRKPSLLVFLPASRAHSSGLNVTFSLSVFIICMHINNKAIKIYYYFHLTDVVTGSKEVVY